MLRAYCSLALTGLLVVTFLTGTAAWVHADMRTQSGSHMQLSGVVEKVQSGVVFVKTPVGTVTVSSKTGLKDARVGEAVNLWVNENNIVIDVHRKGEKTPAHRFITGELTFASPDKTTIKLWTPEGEQVFPVSFGKAKLSNIPEGTAVTVEVNQDGQVIDVHRMQVDLQVVKTPRNASGTQMKLSGTVLRSKSGVVFVDTPAGMVALSQNMIPADVEPGQELTLWVNENNVVIDVHKADGKAVAHRFITGELTFASPDKTQIKIWTPEGEKTLVVEFGKAKLSGIKEGSLVTLQLNEAGKVIDVRKAG